MFILFFYFLTISLGNLQMTGCQEMMPLSNTDQLKSERNSPKKTVIRPIGSLQDLQVEKTKNNCSLTDKSVYKENHYKDIENKHTPAHQKKEAQFVKAIAQNADKFTYLRYDTEYSRQPIEENANVGTNFDNTKSTRRFLHNQNLLSGESRIITVNNLLPSESQIKLDEFEEREDRNMITSNIITIERNNYNEIAYKNYEDEHNDDEINSIELAKLDNDIASQIKEPTKGLGISEMIKSRIMIMEHPRVCYACSSANDISCWTPDRRTSVKYCREDHTSCLTKVFKDEDNKYIIRDCGSACLPTQGLESKLKYNFCTICHYDLCNTGYSTKMEVVIIFIIMLFNYIISL